MLYMQNNSNKQVTVHHYRSRKRWNNAFLLKNPKFAILLMRSLLAIILN